MKEAQLRISIENLIELTLETNDENHLQTLIQEHETLYAQQTTNNPSSDYTTAQQQAKTRILLNTYKAAQAKQVGDQEAYHAHIEQALNK